MTAVTDPLARTLRPGFDQSKVPSNADEFEAYWHNSPEYAQLEREIDERLKASNAEVTDETFKEVLDVEKQKWTLKRSPYTVNFMQQLKLCCKRRVQNLVNNKSYTLTLVAAAIIQSLIIGSLYYNTTKSTIGAFSRVVSFSSHVFISVLCAWPRPQICSWINQF